ncbi:MAG: transporter substrate-binding domain-containing protein [Alphaproteobacteria bacterium]|nr:transporter substrate-binding domain-containing protein [Alphaproteobacteria bacterium]
MRFLLLLPILPVLLASIPIAHAKTPVVILADDDYAPFSMKTSGGDADGLYLEILREAFARLSGYEVTVRPMPWKRGLKQIQQGRAFAIFPPYFWPEQRPYIASYSEPILNERVVVACRNDVFDDAPRTAWPEAYYGLTIANNDGFLTPGQAFFDAVGKGRIELREVADVASGLIMMANGRVDCYVNGELAIHWETQRLRLAGKIREDGGWYTIGAEVSSNYGYVGYSRDGDFPFREDFRRQLDETIRSMQAAGRIEAIVEGYINR